MRELTLFATAGFLFLGTSDLLVDLIWIGLQFKRSMAGGRPASLERLPPAAAPGPLAIFIPAWREAAVIGPMLRHALNVWDRADARLFVGCYPNDPETIGAVSGLTDPRLQLVVNPRVGPTTKADNLNAVWRAMTAYEHRAGRQFKAIVLHDAEDVVHPAELDLFDRLSERYDLVQLPVLPLVDENSRFVAGSYLDEFAESHGRELIVREAIGAAMPSAGVGCAFSRRALGRLAQEDGVPFAAESLTEDYEIGLRLHARGARGTFVRLPASAGRPVIATREHFPAHWRDAVAQKSRWMAGIALAGWDRLGWSGGLAERWMRLRDRQALLAALLLLAAYVSLLATPLVATAAAIAGHPVVLITPALALLMTIATAMLVWRLIMRFAFVTRSYGPVEGLRAIPRVVVSNAIAILAAREAVARYRRARRTGAAEWGKTAHVFPASIPIDV